MIIFCDIDGVLIPGKSYYMPGQTWPIPVKFDPCAVGLLNSLCSKLDAKVVIHSNWRNTEDRRVKRDMRPLTDWFVEQGVQADNLHPQSPQCPIRPSRWEAIVDWFRGLGVSLESPDHMVVLEDLEPPQGWPWKHRVYQTDFEEGLSHAIYSRVLQENAHG